MQQKIIKQFAGLHLHKNPIYEVPDGALSVAENVFISREKMLEKSRGFTRYGLVTADAHSQYFEFKGKLLRLQGSTLSYNSTSTTFVDYAGTFTASTDRKARAIECTSSIYMTIGNKVYKIDKLTNEPTKAGMPAGLDIESSFTGTGNGFFTLDTQVAYRVCWMRRDYNKKEVRGEPSYREIMVNASKPCTITSVAAAASVTLVAHGWQTNDYVTISGVDTTTATNAYYNGTFQITRTGDDTFTYTMLGTPASTPAPGSPKAGRKENTYVRSIIPTEVVAGDYYEVYRTVNSADVYTTPDDNLQLLYQAPISYISKSAALTRAGGTVTATVAAHGLTTGDYVQISGANTGYNGVWQVTVTAPTTFTYTITGTPTTPATGTILCTPKTFTFADTYDAVFLGADLYTNQSQETIAQANATPPFCKDMAFYKDYTFFANTSKESELEIRLIGVSGLTATSDYVSIVAGSTYTFTFNTTEDINARKFKLWSTYSTASENVEETAKSLCRIINLDPSNNDFYAFYTSDVGDPGYILLRVKQHNVSTFSIVANTLATGDNFQPVLPISGTSVSSDNYASPNRLYYSKLQQADSVPSLNYMDIGKDAQDGIDRIISNRDSLFIFKKKEGVFRLSGEGIVEQFALKQLDNTCNIIATDSATLLENSIYVVTTQGVVKVDESGVAIISRDIETEFKKQFAYALFPTITFSVAYESERQLWVFTGETSSDTYPTIAWVYNYLTNTWTIRRKSATCAIVLSPDDKLYLGHAVDKFTLQERKSYGTLLNDYKEEDIAVTITSILSNSIVLTYTYTTTLAAGFVLAQGVYQATITSVTSLGGSSYSVTLGNGDEKFFASGAASVSLPITSLITLQPEAADDVAVLKQFPEIQFYLESDSATSQDIAFFSDIDPVPEYVDSIVNDKSGWGDASWGDSEWGDDYKTSTPLRVTVPRDYQKCRALSVMYKHSIALENFVIAGLAYNFRVISSRTARSNL